MLDDLLESKIKDGARYFVDLPEIVFFDEFYDYTEEHEGAEITEFLTNSVIEMWLDFEFRGHKFSVSNQFWRLLIFCGKSRMSRRNSA